MRRGGRKWLIVIAIWLTTFILVAGGGAWIGSALGGWRQERDRSQSVRAELGAMKTIAIGDVLSDHVFEDLSRRQISLRDLVRGTTLIVGISPTCPSCKYELADIERLATDDQSRARFLILSPENPRLLEDLRDSLGLTVATLYDHRSAFFDRLKIARYPINIVVDSALTIREITFGDLGPENIERFLERGVLFE